MTLINILLIAFALLLLILIVWNIIVFLFKLLISIFSNEVENADLKLYEFKPSRLQPEYQQYLVNDFPYFGLLSTSDKTKFLLRLNHFIRSKKFIGMEALEVTDEMVTRISAAAVQLTFGLERYVLNYFKAIYIYPDIYFNDRSDQYHKGEAAMKGYLKISWKDFCEGYHDKTDGINLGLHELAHALDISRLSDDSDNYFRDYFNRWYAVSRKEFQQMQSNKSFLRDYGATNFREFFAVCVENFFEAPEEFKKELPEIYLHLTVLLRQDPLHYANAPEVLTHDQIIDLTSDEKPLFKSNISFLDSAFSFLNYGYRIIISAAIFIFMIKSYQYIMVFLFIGAIYYINSLLFTRIEIYEKYIVIKRPLQFNRQIILPIESLVSFEISHNNVDSVELHYLKSGNILKYSTLCLINEEEGNQLLDLLAGRNIFTRST